MRGTGRIVDKTAVGRQEKAKVDPFRRPIAKQTKRKTVSPA